MLNEDTRQLSGLLLEWPTRKLDRTVLEQSRQLRFHSTLAPRWEAYKLASAAPLLGEDRDNGRKFEYDLVARCSGSRVLLLAPHREIVEFFIEHELGPLMFPPLRRVAIAVDQLVKSLTSKPANYVLSFAHARVPAFGTSLRAISFYGEDLGEASLFRRDLDLLVFFTCGLREASGGYEIVRLGSEGAVSFYYSGPHRVLEVENALRYLRSEKYLASQLLEDIG